MATTDQMAKPVLKECLDHPETKGPSDLKAHLDRKASLDASIKLVLSMGIPYFSVFLGQRTGRPTWSPWTSWPNRPQRPTRRRWHRWSTRPTRPARRARCTRFEVVIAFAFRVLGGKGQPGPPGGPGQSGPPGDAGSCDHCKLNAFKIPSDARTEH